MVTYSNHQTLGKQILKNSILYLLISPAFMLLALFKYYPSFLAVYRSFYDWNGGNRAIFIGLENYISMVRDPVFISSLRNLGIYILLLLPLTVGMPFVVAELLVNLNSKKVFDLFRNMFIMPMIVPVMVTLLMWKFMYNPQIGAFNQILAFMGFEGVNWLGDPDIAIFSVIFSAAPFIIPLRLLIFIAGLQSIPQELYESAEMEGVTRFRRLINIDIPLTLSQLKLTLILATLALLESFDNVFVLTYGGPMNSTINPALYMYNVGREYLKVGYSSAIGVVLFIAVLILTFINNKYVNSESDLSAE